VSTTIWSWERRFLIAFGEAVLGLEETEQAQAAEAVDRLDRFLSDAPFGLKLTFHLALLVVPPGVVPGMLTKLLFHRRSLTSRRRYVHQLFQKNVDRPPGMMIDQEGILSTVKSMVSGAYCETETVWKRLQYSARVTKLPTHDGKTVVPPAGPELRPIHNSPVWSDVGQRSVRLASVPEQLSVIIIGAGGAGITAAHTLAHRHGGDRQRVALLEAGRLKGNAEFPERTMDGFNQLYMNAGVTPNRSQRIGFIQGRCVGGGTTVNNAGSPRPYGPWRRVLAERWGIEGADLNWVELDQSFDFLQAPLNITQLPDWLPTPGANRAYQGLERLGGPWRRGLLNANLLDCIGCGQCNQGCPYDAHRVPAITLLPEALRRNPELMLVPEATVNKLHFESGAGGRRVAEVEVESGGVKRVLRADRVILTAGAFASSALLLRSGFVSSDNRRRLVGRRFSCNFASPVIGKFHERQDAGRGIQIGYIMEVPERRLIIETAFAPPTVLGMMVSQWGPAFQEKMGAFDYLGVSFPTLSSDAYGSIDFAPMTPWATPQIDFELGPSDWERLGWGLATCAEAMRLAGAEELFDSRFDGEGVRLTGDAVEDRTRIGGYYARFGPHTYVKVQSAHLQGGNVMHRDPTRGVVDSRLKVHGVDNLWILDSSVFPAPITLNIQYTTMALARYGALRL